jgi:hypothetical protein
MADEKHDRIPVEIRYPEECPVYYTNFLGVKQTPYDVIIDVARIDLREAAPDRGELPVEAVSAKVVAQLFMSPEVAAKLAVVLQAQLEARSEGEKAEEGEE